jgi:hypothetical protein
MYCIAITLNGKSLCFAGGADLAFIDVMISGSIYDGTPASLRVTGMKALSNERSAHVYWMEELALHTGDVLVIEPRELEQGTKPTSVVATDSPEYLAEQQAYEDFLGAHVWPQPRPIPLRTTASLKFNHSRCGKLNAAIPIGHQHILCSLLWDSHRPRPASIYARSFSKEGTLEWLREHLEQGESLCVEIGV